MELYFYMGIVFLLTLAEAALVVTAVCSFCLWLEDSAYSAR